MDFQQEIETLYQMALALRKEGHLPESELLETKAAGILDHLKNHAALHPEDPRTTAILLYLAEREWPLLGDHENVRSKLEQAVAISKKQLGANPQFAAEALARLAEFHYLAGRLGEAEPLYRESVALFASSKALGGLAQTLAVLGHPEEADPYFAQAIEKVKGGEDDKRPLYFLLISRAEGLEKLKRHPEAAALRQKAVALLPKNNPGELGFQV